MNGSDSPSTGGEDNTVHVVEGIGILLLSLVCLGTWPALLRLCTWNETCVEPNHDPPARSASISCCGRTLAKSQNRHPCIVYMDYSLAYMVASILPIMLELIYNKSKNESSFGHGDSSSLFSWLTLVAMGGGCLLSVGNLCLQWSTAVYGAPLTTVLALQASLTVVLGTSLNYCLEPSKTAYPHRLALGVVAFLLAIGFASRAQTWYQSSVGGDRNCNFESLTNYNHRIASTHTSNHHHRCRADYEDCGEIEIETVLAAESTQQQKVHRDCLYEETSTSEENDATVSHEVTHHNQDRVRIGLCVAVLGGICFGFFSPAFNIAVNDPFGFSGGDNVGLSVPVANLSFAVAFGLAGIVGNMILLQVQSSNPDTTTWSSVLRFCIKEPLLTRRLALCAGTLCAVGNVLQFQGGHLAGYAASDLVQAFPLVATLWDVAVFSEFRNASSRVLAALSVMYAFYISGIFLLAMSVAV